jgi:hypothetical protein
VPTAHGKLHPSRGWPSRLSPGRVARQPGASMPRGSTERVTGVEPATLWARGRRRLSLTRADSASAFVQLRRVRKWRRGNRTGRPRTAEEEEVRFYRHWSRGSLPPATLHYCQLVPEGQPTERQVRSLTVILETSRRWTVIVHETVHAPRSEVSDGTASVPPPMRRPRPPRLAGSPCSFGEAGRLLTTIGTHPT